MVLNQPKYSLSFQHAHGFTLIEIMIVMVILSIFGAIVGLSVGAGASSKQVQRYDKLVDDLKYARLLAMDEQRVLGLRIDVANNIHPTRYQLLQLDHEALQQAIEKARQATEKTKNRKYGKFDGMSVDMSAGLTGMKDAETKRLWLPLRTQYEKGIHQRLNEQTQLRIEPLEQASSTTNNVPTSDNPIFNNITHETPQIIWYGNGEATPVKVTMFVDDKQIGDAIFIDKLGKVTTDTSVAGI